MAFDISSDVEALDVRRLIQLLVHSCDGAHAERCIFKLLREFRLVILARLEAQHADDQGKAILDPMVHLLDEKLLALQRRIQIALVALTLDRHPQDIGGSLKEREVMLDEVIIQSAVDLQHAERSAIALQDDVHGAANAMSDQNLGRSEALLRFEVIGDHRLAGFQRESGRRSEIRADADDADNAWLPTNARPDEETVFSWNVFEHLAKLGAQALGSKPRRVSQKLVEPWSLQRANAELGKDFLLTHPVMQGVQKRIRRLGRGCGFDDGSSWPIGGRHRIGYAASCGSFAANLCRPARVRQYRQLPLLEQNGHDRGSCRRRRRPSWTGTGLKEIGSR